MTNNIEQTNLLTKQFEDKEVKIILDDNGEPLFELYSIGMALGYARTDGKSKTDQGGQKLFPRKDRIDKTLVNAEITCLTIADSKYLTEEMLYDFMLEAHTDKCKEFRKWITHDVLPAIRKFGVYQDREDIDQDYLKFNFKALKKTFLEAPVEQIRDLYNDCLKWYKDNKVRIPYGANTKRRKDATHTVSDSKIMVMQKIVTILEGRNLSLLEDKRFGLISEIDSVIKNIKDDISLQYNLSNRGKLGGATKTIKKMQEELDALAKELENVEEDEI